VKKSATSKMIPANRNRFFRRNVNASTDHATPIETLSLIGKELAT